jgi:hypothetical protein
MSTRNQSRCYRRSSPGCTGSARCDASAVWGGAGITALQADEARGGDDSGRTRRLAKFTDHWNCCWSCGSGGACGDGSARNGRLLLALSLLPALGWIPYRPLPYWKISPDLAIL